jgi:hypothetical protein
MDLNAMFLMRSREPRDEAASRLTAKYDTDAAHSTTSAIRR